MDLHILCAFLLVLLSRNAKDCVMCWVLRSGVRLYHSVTLQLAIAVAVPCLKERRSDWDGFTSIFGENSRILTP